jgi:integrase
MKLRPSCCTRHTCITRWAKHIDAYTLHVIAGHTDMNTTKRYVHPSDADVLAAIEKARGAGDGKRPTDPLNLH